MSGANMFIMYQSADGTNVTVSPRTASGHSTPSLSSSADISLLEGSGVEGNTMTANIRCGSCSSWSGGSMDFSKSSASWIHATASGTTTALSTGTFPAQRVAARSTRFLLLALVYRLVQDQQLQRLVLVLALHLPLAP
jgi:hypothetical protein